MENRQHQATIRQQMLAYCTLGILSLVIVGLFKVSEKAFYDRFFLGLDPAVVYAVVIAIGLICTYLFLQRDLFQVLSKPWIKVKSKYVLLVLLLSGVSIFLDVVIRFPKDINVEFPTSLFIYPSIAFFVEILFHQIPLALVILAYVLMNKKISIDNFPTLPILLVAVLEPTFQTFGSRDFPIWGRTILWLNLFIFNIVQLRTYQRSGFFSALSLRLLFYLSWHIIWGFARLHLFY